MSRKINKKNKKQVKRVGKGKEEAVSRVWGVEEYCVVHAQTRHI